MSISYYLLDVFADAPFQGTQIPVVVLENNLLEDTKISIAGEFRQTETVFIDKTDTENPISVYNEKEKTTFGAHTTLAAACMASELGLAKNEGRFLSLNIVDGEQNINTFVDNEGKSKGSIKFSRGFTPVLDIYTPLISSIASALHVNEKHINYSKFRPMMASVDHPVLIVPLTRTEHVLSARLQTDAWSELLAEVHASEIFLFAPGSISGLTDFHGRLINPTISSEEFPPIGKVMPEFIGYLSSQENIEQGTHTFSIDRGSLNTRKSVLHAEFDKKRGKDIQCRIGGHVIKIGEGSLNIH